MDRRLVFDARKINWTWIADIPTASVWGGIIAVVISVIFVLSLLNVQIGDIAGWVAAVAAILGLWFAGAQLQSAKDQIQSARDIQREATANDIWMNYEQRGLEYPKYANPELSVLDYKQKTLDGDRQKFYEYEWFVSFMLLACDAVLLLDSRGWEEVVEDNLRYHRPYLKSKTFAKEGLHLQSDAIRFMIEELKPTKTRRGPILTKPRRA
jgi:hypothetical protein